MSASEAIIAFHQRLAQLADECVAEHDRVQSQLGEVELLLRQTTSEIEKLSQRVASIAGRRRDMEANLDDYTRTDIKNIYTSFHETEMRKLIMDNQTERLTGKQQELKAYNNRLERVLKVVDQIPQEIGELAMAGPEQTTEAETAAAESKQREQALRLIEVQEDENLRLLHRVQDSLVQAMANVMLKAEICERLLGVDTRQARGELNELKELVNNSLQDLRDFVLELRPLMMDDLGLEPALRRYAESYSRRNDLQVEVSLSMDGQRLPSLVEVTIFRLVQEALSLCHEGLASQAQIVARLSDGHQIELEISSDGKWSGPEQPVEVVNLKQRVEPIGGRVDLVGVPAPANKVVIKLPTWAE
jgi:two-component system, NarL family, sensor histidine kinase DegS